MSLLLNVRRRRATAKPWQSPQNKKDPIGEQNENGNIVETLCPHTKSLAEEPVHSRPPHTIGGTNKTMRNAINSRTTKLAKGVISDRLPNAPHKLQGRGAFALVWATMAGGASTYTNR